MPYPRKAALAPTFLQGRAGGTGKAAQHPRPGPAVGSGAVGQHRSSVVIWWGIGDEGGIFLDVLSNAACACKGVTVCVGWGPAMSCIGGAGQRALACDTDSIT